MSVERKLALRLAVVGRLSETLTASLCHEPSGSLVSEIAAQRNSGQWRRTTVPLEAGWYATLRHIGAATSHARAFIDTVGAGTHAATAALLVRGALESLAIAAWLLDDRAMVTERSLRALSEVRYSTGELRKLYQAQGFRVDGLDLDDRGVAIRDALARIDQDGTRAGGEVPQRPAFTDLIDGHLLGLGRRQRDSPPDVGPIYRYLSPLAHGTKWAMIHYATPLDDGAFVTTTATPHFVEMLLFYLGVGLLKVGSLGTQRLAWLDLAEHGAREFIQVGPCEVDIGG